MNAVRVHRVVPVSEANGPGLRMVIWVQGCKGVPQQDGRVMHCRGCWNSSTWAQRTGEVISVDDLHARVQSAVREHQIEGVTFSGGEPFQQAESLARLAKLVRQSGLTVMAFTGYTVEFLRHSESAPPGARELLAECDLVIDGPYREAERAEGLPLRGSRNQRLVPLTSAGRALADHVTDDLPVAEFSFFPGETVVTGFPQQV